MGRINQGQPKQAPQIIMSKNTPLAFCLLLPLVLSACGAGSDDNPATPESGGTTTGSPTVPVNGSGDTLIGASDAATVGDTPDAGTSGDTVGDTQTLPPATELTNTAGDTAGDADANAVDNPVDSLSGNTDGNSAENPAESPPQITGEFGLTRRASLADLNLPIEGEQLGDYELVNAYPNLRFLEALLVDDVPGENRMVVVEQAGRIKVFDDNPAVTEDKEILNITSTVVFTGEQGLLGMAFDPRFTENRYVYIYYTEKDTNRSIITRLTWDATTDVLDLSQEKRILEVDQPFHSHNGGMIAFGPDNLLYIALGDGGDGGDPLNNGQDRSTLLASVLRIDVHPQDSSQGYAIPPSNPFVGEANVRGEIYAYGFRNPWRFSFDRETGDMWLGDVGQEGFEEINLVTAGGNYGWRVYEGSGINKPELNNLPESAFTFPVHEYPNQQGKAVIGGYVYRGAVSSLQGRYIFSDFTNGIVTALNWDGSQVTGVEGIATIDGPTSFGESRDGELLVVSRYGGIFKFVESSSSAAFPPKLSQTGLFSDLASLAVASGIVEYAPSHPFWSDGSVKRRWIGVPDDAKIEFTDNDWSFPVGTVSIKHFEMALVENSASSQRRLETRVIYHTQQGWQGFTYRWNSAQTDADLLRDGQTEQLSIALNDGSVRVQQYYYPSRSDCLICHTQASTFLLGLETGQINSNFNYSATTDNQLRSLNNVGLFNYDIGNAEQYKVLPPLTDNSATVESRARAYLDVNCSTCHQPGGTAPTSMDFRFEVDNAGLNAIDTPPQSGSFNITDARIIAPGSKERSIIWHRMGLLEGGRMPPLSTHVVDEAGLQLIGDWIDSM